MGSESPDAPRTSARLKLFDTPEAPSFEQVSTCVHCGFCLEACPTYRELRVETDSPRGRIYLMKGLLNGQLAPEPHVLKHLDQCLDCRACETACPSGVPYAEILERTRTVLEPIRKRPLWAQGLRNVVFGRILPSRRLSRMLLRGLRWAQTWGVLAIGKQLAKWKLLPKSLRAAALSPPHLPPRAFRDSLPASAYNPRTQSHVFAAQGKQRHRVALFTGCLADHMFAGVNQATVEVLTANGCEVHVLANEACCGALHIHNGARDQARDLARRNIEAFGVHNFDAIISNAAGCGAELRHTHTQVPEHPLATAFDAQVQDISEFLVKIGFRAPQVTTAKTVALAYDDPCHLLHAQKISAPPRAVLAALPKYHMVPLQDADTCCGSAGVYSLLQPQLASAVSAKKIAAIAESGAAVVATGNPGCLMQIENGVRAAGLAVRVAHPVELLAEAYRAEAAGTGGSQFANNPL